MAPIQQPLYTSAPILDYDEESQTERTDEQILDAAGVMSLDGEAFDAAVLEALVTP